MRVLLDTNIIIRAAQPNQPTWPEINQSLTALVAHGCTLCVVPQNIYEFWVVATRPQAQNGFGLTQQTRSRWWMAHSANLRCFATNAAFLICGSP